MRDIKYIGKTLNNKTARKKEMPICKIREVEKNGAISFKTEGLTIDQLRDLVLGGPNNFEIIRAVATEGDGHVNRGKQICSKENFKKHNYPK